MMVRKSFGLSAELAIQLGNNAKVFFIKKGVLFPKGSSIELIHGNKLMTFNFKEEHVKLADILSKWINKQQFTITTQLFEIKDSSLKGDFALNDILSLTPKSFKVLETIMVQSIEDQKGLTSKGESFLEATCNNNVKGAFDCKYNWRYKRAGKFFELKDKIKMTDLEDKIIELDSKNGNKFVLLLSARLVDGTSSPLKKKSPDILQPYGKLHIFWNEKIYKSRLFLPKDQDEYIENYYKLKKIK
jgi:hypothetical protein